MAKKLMIVMVNTDPANPPELGAPFFQASVAAAMEYDVEVVLTGRAGQLAALYAKAPPFDLTRYCEVRHARLHSGATVGVIDFKYTIEPGHPEQDAIG